MPTAFSLVRPPRWVPSSRRRERTDQRLEILEVEINGDIWTTAKELEQRVVLGGNEIELYVDVHDVDWRADPTASIIARQSTSERQPQSRRQRSGTAAGERVCRTVVGGSAGGRVARTFFVTSQLFLPS